MLIEERDGVGERGVSDPKRSLDHARFAEHVAGEVEDRVSTGPNKPLRVETRAKRGLRGSFHVWMPALEAFAQVAIETLGAGLKQKVCASFGPSHLLFFDHTAGQHLIDG